VAPGQPAGPLPDPGTPMAPLMRVRVCRVGLVTSGYRAHPASRSAWAPLLWPGSRSGPGLAPAPGRGRAAAGLRARQLDFPLSVRWCLRGSSCFRVRSSNDYRPQSNGWRPVEEWDDAQPTPWAANESRMSPCGERNGLPVIASRWTSHWLTPLTRRDVLIRASAGGWPGGRCWTPATLRLPRCADRAGAAGTPTRHRDGADQPRLASVCLDRFQRSAEGLAFRRAVSTAMVPAGSLKAEVEPRNSCGLQAVTALSCCETLQLASWIGVVAACIQACFRWPNPGLGKIRGALAKPGPHTLLPLARPQSPVLFDMLVLDCPVSCCWAKAGGGASSACCAPGAAAYTV